MKRLNASSNMSSTRVPKVEDFLKKEISQIISSQVRDPRYKFLNIVDVKCSSDLSVATVFYTIIDGDISDTPDYKSIEKKCEVNVPVLGGLNSNYLDIDC